MRIIISIKCMIFGPGFFFVWLILSAGRTPGTAGIYSGSGHEEFVNEN